MKNLLALSLVCLLVTSFLFPGMRIISSLVLLSGIFIYAIKSGRIYKPSIATMTLLFLLIANVTIRLVFEQNIGYEYFKVSALLILLLLVPLVRLDYQNIYTSNFVLALVLMSVAFFWVTSISIGDSVRYSSFFIEPSVFASFLYTYYIILNGSFSVQRNAVIFFGLLMANTVGILLPYMLSILSNFIIKSKSKYGLMVIILVSVYVMYIITHERFLFLFDLIDGEINIGSKLDYKEIYGDDNLGARFRVIHWLNIISEISISNLYHILLGQPDSFYSLVGDDHKPHNDYISVMVSNGVFGLFTFLYILYLMYKNAFLEDRVKVIFLCLAIGVTNFIGTMVLILAVSIILHSRGTLLHNKQQ